MTNKTLWFCAVMFQRTVTSSGEYGTAYGNDIEDVTGIIDMNMETVSDPWDYRLIPVYGSMLISLPGEPLKPQ